MLSKISKMKNNKGFSLIELIVVIAIIGILVMLAAPKFMGYTERAKVKRIQNDVKVVEGKVMEEYIASDYQFDGSIPHTELDNLIGEKTLYGVEGKVEKGNVEEGSYKEVASNLIKEARTKLTGTFYANADGKVYYVDDNVNTSGDGDVPEKDENGCDILECGNMKQKEIPYDEIFKIKDSFGEENEMTLSAFIEFLEVNVFTKKFEDIAYYEKEGVGYIYLKNSMDGSEAIMFSEPSNLMLVIESIDGMQNIPKEKYFIKVAIPLEHQKDFEGMEFLELGTLELPKCRINKITGCPEYQGQENDKQDEPYDKIIAYKKSDILYVLREGSNEISDYGLSESDKYTPIYKDSGEAFSWDAGVDGHMNNPKLVAIADVGEFTNFKEPFGVSEVVIGKNIKNISNHIFSYQGITKVTLGEDVERIGKSAFENNNINNLIIPSKVNTIEKKAFSKNELTKLTIPQNVKNIEVSAFSSNQISNLQLNEGLVYLSGFFNNKINDINIPSTVKEINSYAFGENLLTKVTIPSNVEEIGYNAFAYNNISNLELNEGLKLLDGFANNDISSIDIPNTVTEIGSSAFTKNKINKMIIPQNVEEIKKGAFDRNNITELTLNEGIKVLSGFAFNNLKDIIIPNSVNHIERTAFSGNYLTEVNISDNVKKIGEGAFEGNKITSIKLGNEVENIGTSAFADNLLTDVVMPNSVKRIGIHAFDNNEIHTVNLNEGLEFLAGFNDNKITNVTIPSTVKIIGDYAFGWNLLDEIIIPDRVTEIKYQAFNGNKLKTIYIPDSVNKIEYGGFYKNSLESINIKGNIYTKENIDSEGYIVDDNNNKLNPLHGIDLDSWVWGFAK